MWKNQKAHHNVEQVPGEKITLTPELYFQSKEGEGSRDGFKKKEYRGKIRPVTNEKVKLEKAR